MKIIYSFNKKGFESEYWAKEIVSASTNQFEFVPFNHDVYLEPLKYIRAQLLDNLYFQEHPGLLAMYSDLENKIQDLNADVLLVDNCNPYHPDYLRRLKIYKVLRTGDGPMAAYDRDFAYLHAFDHILYHSPAYSKDMGMEEKLRYCGVKNANFWPLGSFDALCDPSKTETDILSSSRDVDVVFVGALHLNKMPLIAAVKKALGHRLRLHGLATLKKNIYFNLRYGFPGLVSYLPFEDYVPLYQRSKIGINIHNRGDFTIGGARMFDLPANGVMQITDGGKFLDQFFEVGKEVESYQNADELIDKVKYYLSHDSERESIALNGFRRVKNEYRFSQLLVKAASMIQEGLSAKNEITRDFAMHREY